jgi:autotransporter-associated beta strand protein
MSFPPARDGFIAVSMESFTSPSVVFRHLTKSVSLLCLSVVMVSPSRADDVYFEAGTVLSTPENWQGGALPTGLDQAVFVDDVYGGPLPASLTNGMTQTWGSLLWNSNSSSTLSGSGLGLTGAGGANDLIVLGVNATSATLTLAFSDPLLLLASGNINVVNAGATLVIQSPITDGGNGYGLTKTGQGQLTLTGVNTYAGPTRIEGGTLLLNFNAGAAPVSDIINPSSGLQLAGGSLSLTGKNNTASSQTFNNTTFAAGASTLTATRTGSGSMSVNLGMVTREVGALGRFVLPASGAIHVSNSGDANGLLGPGMLVGTANWAAVDENGNVVAFSDYTASNNVSAWTEGANITTLNGGLSGSLSADLALNSLRFGNGGTGQSVNLGGNTLTVANGILVSSDMTRDTRIHNGNLTGANGELILINNNNNNSTGNATRNILTIDANIVDNGTPTALTVGTFQTGVQLELESIDLGGTNTYTGPTHLNSGRLRAKASTTQAFGLNSAMIISTGAILDLNNTNQSVGSLASRTANDTGSVVLGSGTLTVGGNNEDAVFRGVVSGSTGGLIKVGSGVQTLTGDNTYEGLTQVHAGTLLIDGSLAGAVEVANGATLGGSGIIAGVVTTAGVDSVLSPGNSPGTLSLLGGLDASAGAHFVFELGTTPDFLNLGSAEFLGSEAEGGLVFDFHNAGGLLSGQPYMLIMFGSSSGLDYTDFAVNILPDGFLLDMSFGTNGFLITEDSVQVQFSVVPEPATLAFLGLGLGLLLWRRKRLA